jgi:hypothetical protein
MAAGAVGGLRHVKTAIAAARLVMERTTHTLLVGLRASQVGSLNQGADSRWPGSSPGFRIPIMDIKQRNASSTARHAGRHARAAVPGKCHGPVVVALLNIERLHAAWAWLRCIIFMTAWRDACHNLFFCSLQWTWGWTSMTSPPRHQRRYIQNGAT